MSYKFEDIEKQSGFDSLQARAATSKQASQLWALAKLSHVREKILEEKEYGKDWEGYWGEEIWCVEYHINELRSVSMKNYGKRGIVLTFPTKEMSDAALEDNKELYIQYLKGIES